MQYFMTCGNCRKAWPTQDSFLSDPGIRIIGYQAAFAALETGGFLFNHSCGTTLALPVSRFRNLHHGPIFQTRQTGTDQCPGHCLNSDNLSPCPAQCECGFVREIIQVIRAYPAPTGAAGPTAAVGAKVAGQCLTT